MSGRISGGGSGTRDPDGATPATATATGVEHEVVPEVGVDESFQVETHGINPIPVSDRHGSRRELFWVWMGSNIIFTYVIFGAILLSFGVSLTGAFTAVLVGNLLYFPGRPRGHRRTVDRYRDLGHLPGTLRGTWGHPIHCAGMAERRRLITPATSGRVPRTGRSCCGRQPAP